MEVASVRRGRKGCSKYLYWDELEIAWASGSSILIFQHFARKERANYVTSLLDKMAHRTNARLIGYFVTANVVFLLAGQARHVGSLKEAIRLASKRWEGQVDCGIR